MLHTPNNIKISLSMIKGALTLSLNIIIRIYVFNQLTDNQFFDVIEFYEFNILLGK